MSAIDTIYFRGTDAEMDLAKQLSRGDPDNPYGAGMRRLAAAFEGEFEPCKRVVLLPGVMQQYADWITSVFSAQGVPILRYQPPEPEPAVETPVAAAEPAHAVPTPLPAPPKAPKAAAEAKALSNAQLRRLTTRALRDIANGHGIDPNATPDRATLIAAIEASAKG